MEDGRTISEGQEQPPLSWHDLPEGFGATGRLVPTGVRWTLVEIVRGRSLLIFLSALLTFMTVFFVRYLLSSESPAAALGSILGKMADLALTEEYAFAEYATGLTLALAPYVLEYAVPCTLLVWVVYNVNERRTPAIPRAKEVHSYDARFKWNVVFAAIIGVLCFIVLLLGVALLFDVLMAFLRLGGLIPYEYETSDTTMVMLSIVALMLSEIPNRYLAGRGDANALLVEGVAAGGYDEWLPDRLRSPRGRALVARLLGVGAANTVRGAVWLTRAIEAEELVEDLSDALGELLDAFVTVITFGAFALVERAAEDAETACADNAERGVQFGDPDFEWPRTAPGELRVRNRRTVLFAGLLLLCVLGLQVLLGAAL